MKAAVCDIYGPPSVVHLADIPMPAVGPKQIRIQVKAASINASDVRIRALDAGPGVRGKILATIMRCIVGLRGPRKRVLGGVVSGVVESVGTDVTQFKVGDEVFAMTGLGFGGFAEYCVTPAQRAVALKPKTASFEQAAALPFGANSAMHFLYKVGLANAKRVLVYGSTGAVGTAAVQLAKHHGAEVVAVCGPAGAELSQKLGASTVYNYKTTSLADIQGSFDIVFDAVGKITKHDAAHLLGSTGRYATVAGSDVAKETSANLRTIAELYDAGELVAVVDRTYPLEQIVEANEYVDTGHKQGNVVIVVS